ncbi:baseplate J/gp47 family protein [Lactobacillus crispatus]|uniref:baseplate J/gp47 family protein n=1 Tax=Lactobacillus crispatus TaxID=47770 RepID=UPI001F09929A|nr:baseplate J/gp47 family protein [Lactobacillus crispatus]MCT7852867.1 baseplate J/gp47 family protein [Lactobacillus crispatus]
MPLSQSWGLTENGFIAPTYEEVLDSVEDDFISKFGDDIVLTSNSNFGIIARLIAWRETLMIQELQQNYYAAFISTATDTSLDRVGSNMGVGRKVAQPAFATIEVTTDGQYLIETGETFETDDGYVFDLIKDITTTQQPDGTWKGTGIVQSEENGSMNNVAANKITMESNPDDNVLSITNPEPAGGGQDYEDDETYRARLLEENAAKPGPTALGMTSALMELPGVRDVNPVENDKADADKWGNPPYSVHIYVLGGDDNEIAHTIVNHEAAGITLVGSKAIDVQDATGNKRTVHFDHAIDKPIYVKVKVNVNENWNDDEGADDIKTAVADYINHLIIGKTLFLTRLYPLVYGVNGIDEATIMIGTHQGTLGGNDIVNDINEAVSCDTNNIEVDINGV